MKVTSVALILILCLFGSHQVLLLDNFAGTFALRTRAALADPAVQWLACLCLGIYLIVFTRWCNRRGGGNWRTVENPGIWLMGTILAGAGAYIYNYPEVTKYATFPMLLLGATLGQGAMIGAGERTGKKGNWICLVMVILLTLLSCASTKYAGVGMPQNQYRGQSRWVGAWDDPNDYGLLMGTGVVLALGLVLSISRGRIFPGLNVANWKGKLGRIIIITSGLAVTGIMGLGLWCSYSRGAWLATLFGLGYLTRQLTRCQGSGRGRSHAVPWLIIALSVCVLAFGQIHHFEIKHLAIRRALSVGNMNDFSWRNRIAAWIGDLQIMADQPWLGCGWDQPVPLYDHYFCSPKLGRKHGHPIE